jgi:hypothetical protein
VIGCHYRRLAADGGAMEFESTDFTRSNRPLVHVVDTEDTTPLQSLAMVVDSANGVGAALHPEKFTFMNTDSVVHVRRLPVGEDFGLRARGSFGPDGIGVTTAEIFDRSGFIGTSAQTLLLQRRRSTAAATSPAASWVSAR